MKEYSSNTQQNSIVNIVTALPCEAKPIVDYFKLKKMHKINYFPVFCNNEKSINVIVSSIGKIKSAAATTFIHMLSGDCKNCCYLNLGIAGSIQHTLGEPVIANKITDFSTGTSYYPRAIYNDIAANHVISFDQPQANYVDQGLIDMEAAAFFQAANIFVTREQIQVLKIISDNNEESLAALNAPRVSELIHSNIETIAKVINTLETLSSQEAFVHQPPVHFKTFCEKWHFSEYQKNQLHELLRRWQVVTPDTSPMDICEGGKSSKMVIEQLIASLDNADYRDRP